MAYNVWEPWTGKQASADSTSSWHEKLFFHSENIINSGSRPTASDSVCAQNKKSWVWKEENSGRWWCAEPRKWMVSCFTATHPPINRGLGWAPNKTISPLPGTHLRLYCEQRSAAAGTERFEAEIILSAISHKYLTEKGERERWGERKRQGGGHAGAVGWRGCQGTFWKLGDNCALEISNKLKVRLSWGFAGLFESRNKLRCTL